MLSQKKKVCVFLTICMTVFLLAGCEKEETGNEPTDNQIKQKMEQNVDYVEEALELPESLSTVNDMGGDKNASQQEFIIGTSVDENDTPAIVSACISTKDLEDASPTNWNYMFKEKYLDENMNWQDVDWPFADALKKKAKNRFPSGFGVGTDNRKYFVVSKYTGEIGEDWDDKLMKSYLYRNAGDDVEEVKCDGLSKTEDGETQYCSMFVPCDDETIICAYNDGSIALYDLTTGELIKDYSQKTASKISVFDGNLFCVPKEKDKILVLDKNTEEILSTIPVTVTESGIAMYMNTMGDIYYMVESGIYRISDDMKSSEQIVKGEIFQEIALSTETKIDRLVERNGDFFALFNRNEEGNTGLKLYSYTSKDK